MMSNMGGEDDLPDLDGADDVRFNSFCICVIKFSKWDSSPKLFTNHPKPYVLLT